MEQNARRRTLMDLFSLVHNEDRACEAALAAALAAAAAEIHPKEEGQPTRRQEARGSRIIMTASSTNTPKNPLAALLAHQRYIINDGGMGTLLEALIGEPLDPKLW